MGDGYEKRTSEENLTEEKRKKEAGNTVAWEDVDMDTEEDEDRKVSRKRKAGKKFRLAGSVAAKIVAFIILAFSCLAGLGAGGGCLYLEMHGFYTDDWDTVMMEVMRSECLQLVNYAHRYVNQGDMDTVYDIFKERNADMQLISVDDDNEEKIIWSTRSECETNLTEDFWFYHTKEGKKPVSINGQMLEDGEMYLYRINIDPAFPWQDDFRNLAELVAGLYEFRFQLVGLAAGGILLCLISFLFLMCSAGHRNGYQRIAPGVLTAIPLDVLTLLFVGAAVIFTAFLVSETSYWNDFLQLVFLVVGGTVLAVWMTLYLMDIAVRLKLGKFWRHSLIFILLKGSWRACCFLVRGLKLLVTGVPLVMTTVIVYLGISILEFMGVLLFIYDETGILLWAIEKVILLPVVLYIALTCRKLLEASKALAEGKEDYRVDTARMVGDFKKHGENLNSLAQGISKVVSERMKSERMKTELISNVSHDLKTPLTSIINYADLIWEEVNLDGNISGSQPLGIESFGNQEAGDINFSQEFYGEMGPDGKMLPEEILKTPSVDYGKIREYAEVLLRQSRRLKKLLEDLVEASKATTGNLEVNLEPCEVGVLLSQAVGEYQQRMESKQLELIARQPEEPVKILADGRRLWRVFENLLNNICKYAQENSRVYLNVAVKEGYVQVIFRNMSKYPLDISAEELEERFVRGDKSRHMEGNGLGLSIAKSLVELQNGQMEIVIDGDLFKVVLSFPLLSQ